MNEAFPALSLDREALSNFPMASRLEWIITNGLGGYASSTVLGLNTRKYHGLLVAAFNPPVDRRVLVAKLDEQFLDAEGVYPTYSNEFHHGIHPQGHDTLERFSRFPFPMYTYQTGGARLRKTIFMPFQKNAVIVSYDVEFPRERPLELQIRPLVNFRHFHAVTSKKHVDWGLTQELGDAQVLLHAAQPPSTLAIASTRGQYQVDESWVDGLFFRTDDERGTSSVDDCFIPGRFEVPLPTHESTRFQIVVAASEDPHTAGRTCAELLKTVEASDDIYPDALQRAQAHLQDSAAPPSTAGEAPGLRQLRLAADSFIVHRASTQTKTIIAGYHWFEDWGRDALISLPGLTLVTHRFAEAREILRTFKHYVDRGIIPNRFPDAAGDSPVYNTVDATLWYFNAVLQYLKYTHDFRFVKDELWAMLQSVVDRHTQGTINNIRRDVDGLLAHGPQLTWMDAMIDDKPVTPREGKAVEIQALWYNALSLMQLLATRFEHSALATKYREMAHATKVSFREQFWNAAEHHLFDVVTGEQRDASVRPNQVFAVSLDFSMLDADQQAAVVSIVQEKLVTPFGLRTLSPEDPRYRGRYGGDWNARNYAYHNGTVWPWLTGPFVTAFTKTGHFDAARRRVASDACLHPLLGELARAGVGTLSEVYDGDPPHRPGGCISQAWSVAETLRAYVEDVLLQRPSFEGKILNDFHREG